MTSEPPSGREQPGLNPGHGGPDGESDATSGEHQRQGDGGGDPVKRPTSVRDAVAGRRQGQGNRGRRGRGKGRGRRGRDRPAPADPRAHEPSEPNEPPVTIQPPEPVEREIDIGGQAWRAVSDGASVAASSIPLLSVRFEAPPGETGPAGPVYLVARSLAEVSHDALLRAHERACRSKPPRRSTQGRSDGSRRASRPRKR